MKVIEIVLNTQDNERESRIFKGVSYIEAISEGIFFVHHNNDVPCGIFYYFSNVECVVISNEH